MPRSDLATAVKVVLAQLTATGDRPLPHVDARWIAKSVRGQYRWCRTECRAALRHLFATVRDEYLGFHRLVPRDV